MKKSLNEEILRIIEINNYANLKLKEQEIKIDPSKKADLVKDDVSDFYNTLNDIIKNNGLSEQKKGSMEYQKSVETMQIGLLLLGYELPVHGVDGLYGPETSRAVEKFTKDNLKDVKYTNIATPQIIEKLIELLKQKNIKSEDIKKYSKSNIDISNVTDESFYKKLLQNLGAPESEENIKFLLAWRQAEGKSGKYNPFNTTYNMPGSTNFNKVGVKNYNSMEDGLIATLKTLKHSRYECIVNGLRDDIGSQNISKCESLKTWGTGDLVTKVLRGYESGSSPKAPSIA